MKHIKTISLSACVMVLLLQPYCFADEPGEARDRILSPGAELMLIGLYGGVNFNLHDGYFTTKQGDLICCEFDDGFGIGIVGGVKAYIPLTEQLLLSPRIGYESLGGTFDAKPQQYPIFGLDNNVELATFENELETTIHTLAVDIHASYLIAPFGLYVTAGPSVTFLLSTNYVKTERIVDPPGVPYLDGTFERQLYDGDLELTESVVFSLRGGIGALLEVSNNLFLNPEVLYGFPLTKISKEHDWKASSVQVTLGILFVL